MGPGKGEECVGSRTAWGSNFQLSPAGEVSQAKPQLSGAPEDQPPESTLLLSPEITPESTKYTLQSHDPSSLSSSPQNSTSHEISCSLAFSLKLPSFPPAASAPHPQNRILPTTQCSRREKTGSHSGSAAWSRTSLRKFLNLQRVVF